MKTPDILHKQARPATRDPGLVRQSCGVDFDAPNVDLAQLQAAELTALRALRDSFDAIEDGALVRGGFVVSGLHSAVALLAARQAQRALDAARGEASDHSTGETS